MQMCQLDRSQGKLFTGYEAEDVRGRGLGFERSMWAGKEELCFGRQRFKTWLLQSWGLWGSSELDFDQGTMKDFTS